MNRRKYLASLGLIGVGGYATYNTIQQPSIATNIDLTNSITIPETQVEEDLNIKIEFEEFEIKPVNFYNEEREITIRARTIVPDEYGSNSEWNTDIEPVTVKDELVSISEDKLIIPLEVNNAEYNDAFTLEVEFEFIGPERTLHTISENITVSIGEGFQEAPDDLETIWEEMDTNEDGAKIITDIYELQAMNQDLSHSYVLGNDINANGTEQWNDNRGFNPIGNSNNTFNGNFNGQKYKIINLTINRLNDINIGLFGINEGDIENTKLIDVNIYSEEKIGGFVGQNKGTINQSYVTGKIKGKDATRSIGGFVGQNKGTINQSYANCNVDGGESSNNNENRDIGGFVGQNRGGNIYESYATGDSSGRRAIGGFVGFMWGGNIDESYSTGSVDGSRHTGGFVGDIYDGTVNNVYWDTESSGQTSGDGTGLTTSEMQGESASDSLDGFDFDEIWETVESEYPVLQNLDKQEQLDNR